MGVRKVRTLRIVENALQPNHVMAGLDPAIPVLRAAAPEDVDPRDKPGDDEQTRFVAHSVVRPPPLPARGEGNTRHTLMSETLRMRVVL